MENNLSQGGDVLDDAVMEPAEGTAQTDDLAKLSEGVDALVSAKVSEIEKLHQSRADKAIDEAKAMAAQDRMDREQTEARLNQVYLNSDNETRSALDQVNRDAELAYYKNRERTDSQRREQSVFLSEISKNQDTMLKNAGVSLDDPRIDRGANAATPRDIMFRFNESMGKIYQQDKEKAVSDVKVELEARLERIEKATGVNEVDSSTPGRASTGSLADIEERFNRGEASQAQLSEARKKEGIY